MSIINISLQIRTLPEPEDHSVETGEARLFQSEDVAEQPPLDTTQTVRDADAESAARDSVTPPGLSPVHEPSAEANHSSDSNKRQTPESSALSSPIETASAGKAETSDTVTTGQPTLVAGGGSLDEFGEKARTVLGALPVAAGRPVFAGFLGYTAAAQIVGAVIAWAKDLPRNEYLTLIADLRIYCGVGLLVIVFIATLVQKTSKK